MEDVRYYTTKPLSGSISFKCIFCDHNVTTQDFDSLKGNRRTQAAAVMNQHAAEFHLRSRLGPGIAKLDSRGVF